MADKARQLEIIKKKVSGMSEKQRLAFIRKKIKKKEIRKAKTQNQMLDKDRPPIIEDTETIDFDLMTEDPPELIVDGQFDAGIILTEQLGLELDPFPRSPGARFDNLRDINSANRPDRYSNNPFAILKKLK